MYDLICMRSETSFYLIMPLCIYFQMGYDLDRFGVSFVTGVNKVHFFISMASDRNSSDHCDGLPSCNASILLPLFVSMNSRCMLFLFSAQHLFEARIKQTFEFSASRTSQTDIRKIRKIRIFRLQPSPPVSGALDLLLYLLRAYAGSSPLVPT